MNYNIYMSRDGVAWAVVPFNKPFATIEEAQLQVRILAKRLNPDIKLGIHEGADHSKTADLGHEPSYIHGQ
jgi:hypothetical protein